MLIKILHPRFPLRKFFCISLILALLATTFIHLSRAEINEESPKSPTSLTASASASAPTSATTNTNDTWKISYFHHDHLGNITVVTDEHGNLLEVKDYLPFGGTNVDEHYGDSASDYSYNDKEKDDESNLYYYGARYYNQTASTFTSVDPVSRFATSAAYLVDPQQWNSYSYTRNNPINFIDPFGLYNVETGLIEKGDTEENIVEAVNKALEITTNWETIADVSFFQDRFGTTKVNELIEKYTYVGTNDVKNVTEELHQYNLDRASIAQGKGFGLLDLIRKFRTDGPWDLKNSNDPIFGSYMKDGEKLRKYWAYIYEGALIRFDAPGNINFGYVSHSIGVGKSLLKIGAALEQMINKKTLSGDNPGDWAYIERGYNSYPHKTNSVGVGIQVSEKSCAAGVSNLCYEYK